MSFVVFSIALYGTYAIYHEPSTVFEHLAQVTQVVRCRVPSMETDEENCSMLLQMSALNGTNDKTTLSSNFKVFQLHTWELYFDSNHKSNTVGSTTSRMYFNVFSMALSGTYSIHYKQHHVCSFGSNEPGRTLPGTFDGNTGRTVRFDIKYVGT